MKTYKEKLLDPLWQKKRLEIFDERGFKCEICGDEETTLHVHHKLYLMDTEPWEYENEDLQVLCSNCHKEETDNKKKITQSIKQSLYYLTYEELDFIDDFAGTLQCVCGRKSILKDFRKLKNLISDDYREATTGSR